VSTIKTASRERAQQKRRTRRLLLATAASLLRQGTQPSVAEVADVADVSRRTAYRYFPTQEQMLIEAALEGLRPVMEAALDTAPAGTSDREIEARVDALVGGMIALAFEHEPLLRTMIRLTVTERKDEGTRPRGSRRLEWIASALKPIRARLGRARYARLEAALAVVVGIEAVIVLRDLCGLKPDDARAVVQWTARAALRESLAELKRSSS
jgi:AcrR family transcriptional regulator